jgi:hypothetical protein
MDQKTVAAAFLKSLVVAGVLAANAQADHVIIDDLIVQGSACVGTNCVQDMEFGFSTIVVDAEDPSLLFTDTSNTASFPSVDWRVGVDGSSGNFSIQNEDSGDQVLVVSSTGNGVALGADSELVDGAVSVGASDNLRRVINVADGTDPTDAVTLSQLNDAVTTMEAGYSDQLTSLENRVDDFDEKIDEVGAIGSAMSALVPNPRSSSDNSIALGIGHYGDQTALAIGSFHYLNNDRILFNAGLGGAVGGGNSSPVAVRAGVTIGF